LSVLGIGHITMNTTPFYYWRIFRSC